MRNAGVLFAALLFVSCAEPNAAGPDKFVPTGPFCGHGGLDTDPKHCGECDTDCTALPGVVADRVTCVQGSCNVRGACASGFEESDDGKLCLEPIAGPPDMAMTSTTTMPGDMAMTSTTTPPPDMAQPPVVMPSAPWTKQTSPVTNQNFYGVWGDASGTRFVVGGGGIVLRSARGAAFSTMPSSTNNLMLGVWGVTAPYAAGWLQNGNSGSGAYFTPNTSGTWVGSSVTNKAMNSIWGSAVTDIFLVGNEGAVAHWIGTRWSTGTITSGGARLNGVWGSAADDVYTVGANGIIEWTTGNGSWKYFSSGTTQELMGVWGSSAFNVYVVGRGGTILYSPGDGTFERESSGTTDDLYAVWGYSATDVYAVGYKGVIVHTDGSGNWTKEDSKVTETLWGIWGSAADGVTVVGNAGTILHK